MAELFLGSIIGPLTPIKNTQTHSDSSQETFWHVGDNDTDEEDDGLQPGVSKDEGENEEGHAEEDRHASDDVDEVLDLDGDRGASNFEARG